MSSVRTSLLAVFATTVLVLGASACSGDDKAENTGTATAESDGAEANAGGDTDGSSEGADDASEPAFGVSRDEIAEAMEAAMPGVDTVDVDGTTLKLNMPEGSVDDPMNQSDCRIATELVGIDDTVILVLPDGEFECGVDDQED